MVKTYLFVCVIITLSSCTSNSLHREPSFALYGNWCGPEHPKIMSNALLPIDQLDASCMRHDLCYADKGNYACECDKIISEELKVYLLAESHSPDQKYYARSFYQYFKNSWCYGTPDSKTGASRALHSLYKNTSEKTTSVYDYILGGEEEHAAPEGAPVTTSQHKLKKK